ncbi:MAG: M14 family zinc carboxypeptidase [Calditrichia bacterium]
MCQKLMRICLIFLLVIPVFAGAKEFYLKFPVTEITDFNQIAGIISLDNVRTDTVFAYANEAELADFKSLGIPFTILPAPSSLYYHRMSSETADVLRLDSYPTYGGYLQMMEQFATNYPQICRLDTIGYTTENRLLLSLVISDNVYTEEREPEFFYTSSMHGDELVGAIMLLKLADYLLTNYGDTLTVAGRRVTHMVNNMEICLNPLFNPDGTYNGGNNTVSGATRYNANGKDLNRNFPDRLVDPFNTPAGREKETQEMLAYASRHNFIMSANFHGGAQVANYPWDNGAPSGSYSMCPDDAWFIKVSKAYATLNPDLMNGGWPNGITNGCAWYVVNGGRQDWMYFFEGGREITIELSNIKLPSASTLENYWQHNRESLLAYMEQAFNGIRGVVTDAETGLPVEAGIEVIGYPNVPVYSDPDLGDFYRLLMPGSYDLVVSAEYYSADTLHNITVLDSGFTEISVQLQPLPRGYVYGKARLADTTTAAGITVTLQDQSVLTNANGFFAFPKVYADSLKIRFTKDGYSPAVSGGWLAGDDTLWVEATLFPASGSILIISDDNGERRFGNSRREEAENVTIRSKHRGAASLLFKNTLESAGYGVTMETSAQTNSGQWNNYQLVVWSSGANSSPISSTVHQNDLIDYVNNGGRLIVEGGEIGYDHRSNNPFAQTVLRMNGWVTDDAGNLKVKNSSHPITANLAATIPLNYSSYGDQDAVNALSPAQVIIENSSRPNTGGVVADSQVVFMAFNIAAVQPAEAQQLILNTARYLVPLQQIQQDIAIVGIPGFRQGDLIPGDSLLPLHINLKNFGRQARPAGDSVTVFFSRGGNYLYEYRGVTQDSLQPGESIDLNLGDWQGSGKFGEWQISAALDTSADEISGNNKLNLQFSEIPANSGLVEDFESGMNHWTIYHTDSLPAINGWQRASWPAGGGWYSACVLPGQNNQQDEWLVSPRLSLSDSLYFYWDYGSGAISGNKIMLLASTTDSLKSSFTDTLLYYSEGDTLPANGFSEPLAIDLSAYRLQNTYLAFVYQGSSSNYFALDNFLQTVTPSAISGGISQVPSTFQLLPNFPNPFNPATTIRYNLPVSARVSVEIFNLLGQKVKSLAKTIQPAGIHEVVWNGDESASGVYLCRMNARDLQNGTLLYKKEMKMLLLK